MGNDIETGRTGGTEPIKRVLTYLLFLVTRFIYQDGSKLEVFIYKKVSKKKI